MREPKIRGGVRASLGENFPGEVESGEEEKPFEPCQLPGLTGVRSHHSLFGLLGFRGTSDAADVDTISRLAPEPSTSPFDPSSLGTEPFSLPLGPAFHSASRASVKHDTLDAANLSVVETSTGFNSPSQPASGAMADPIKLDPAATKVADFAFVSKMDSSATSNTVETSGLASAAKLVSDVFHSSSNLVSGLSNHPSAEEPHSHILAIPGQDSSVQTNAGQFGSDISAIPAQDSSVQTTAEDFPSATLAIPV